MSQGVIPGDGAQLNQSGQLGSCSQPQPQALKKYVVFAGQEKSMSAHWPGLIPMYFLRCCSVVGLHRHAFFVQPTAPPSEQPQVLQPSPAGNVAPTGYVCPWNVHATP